jgi:hypothetical protein
MRRGSFTLVVVGMIALSLTAHADTIVNTVAFTETLLIGTDTFEIPAGSQLFVINGVGYSGSLSPVIASGFASNAPCNFCFSVPAGSPLPIQIQSTAALIPEFSEYDFLTQVSPDYVVVGGAGPALAFPGGVSDAPTDFIGALVTAGRPDISPWERQQQRPSETGASTREDSRRTEACWRAP